MLKANLYRLRQCILTWDCLVPLTMLALVRQANGLCQTQRYWLLCSQGLEYGLCFELLRSALSAQALGVSSLACDNGTAVVLYGLAGEGGGSMSIQTYFARWPH